MATEVKSACREVEVVCGTVLHSTPDLPLQVMTETCVGFDKSAIRFISPACSLNSMLQKYDVSQESVLQLHKNQFLMPGLIDTHTHAPQHPNSALALDLPLLDWLQTYTFPTESKFKDLNYAAEVYDGVVRRTLSHGTTTASYFASIHREASELLATLAGQYGQRAFVGKVNMDTNSPDYYTETTDESIRETRAFVTDVRSMKNRLVQPILTPRFALSCTSRLMDSLGAMAHDLDLHVQSHLSETQPECKRVKAEFPHHEHYTDVYRDHGLLGPKTVMAHGIHLSDEEVRLLADTGTSIAHCPNSNVSIRSGLCHVRNLESHGVNISLGTDVSGGYHPSVFDAMKHALLVSKIRAINETEHSLLTYQEAFRLATLGGAKALALEERVGNFAVGKDFDAIVVDLGCEGTPVDIFGPLSPEDLLQKLIYLGDDRNMVQVYTAGTLRKDLLS